MVKISYYSFNNIEIAGIAAAVPTQKVNVDSFIPLFGEDTVEKFKTNVGVLGYHKSREGQTASDLGLCAAENLLSKLEFDRKRIGLLAFVSLSQDYFRPSTACVLQYRLKLDNSCTAFDIGLGCSGFAYGLQITSSMMQNSDVEWALMLCCDTASQVMYHKDKATAMLIGDAGTAILLHKTTEEYAHSIHGLLGTEGEYYKACIVPAGSFRHRNVSKEEFIDENDLCRTNYHYLMSGIDVFSFAITTLPTAFKHFFELTKTQIDSYDSLILHQANKMIIQRLVKKLKCNIDAPISLDRYGNTSSPSIPLALCDAYANENKKRKILSCGFGTGLSYGITSFELDTGNVFPVVETDEVFEDGLIK